MKRCQRIAPPQDQCNQYHQPQTRQMPYSSKHPKIKKNIQCDESKIKM